MQNNSHIISEESKTVMNKKVSSNQFRHAMHTYDKDTIGTETMAAALQHSEVVAKKHYNSKESSAFPRFYDLVTAAKKTSDIEMQPTLKQGLTNMKIRAANLKFWLQTKTKEIPTKLSLMIGSPLPMTNGIWDQVREAENNVVVDFFEAVGENR